MGYQEFPIRKSPAHLPVLEIPNRSNIVFVTGCSQGRKNIIANNETFFLIQQAWDTAKSWKVGNFTRSYSLILCSFIGYGGTTDAMDPILEILCFL